MSTGSFVNSRYEDSQNGDIHFIKVQPETLDFQIGSTVNLAPTGAINNQKRAFVSSRRRRGAVCARKIGIRITAAGPNNYKVGSIIYVPVLRPSNYIAMIEPEGQLGIYNGSACEVVGGSAERYNQ